MLEECLGEEDEDEEGEDVEEEAWLEWTVKGMPEGQDKK